MASYTGGKNGHGAFQNLINMMPPHGTYIELFLGSGAVIRNKRPAHTNIGVEIDSDVFREFVTEGEGHWIPPNVCSVTMGSRLFGGKPVDVINTCAFEFLEQLPEMAKMDQWPRPWLLYADPPYLGSVRQSQNNLYKHEMQDDASHRDLLEILKIFDGFVMISGYESPLYNEHLWCWRKETFHMVNRAGQQTTETVWLNFPEPAQLHDYSFLGSNYRERYWNKRMKRRWRRKLQNMEPLRRAAMFQMFEDLKPEFIDSAPPPVLSAVKESD